MINLDGDIEGGRERGRGERGNKVIHYHEKWLQLSMQVNLIYNFLPYLGREERRTYIFKECFYL